MQTKSLVVAAAIALPGILGLAAEPAHAWKKGLDIVTVDHVVLGNDKVSPRLWVYDRETGRGYQHHLSSVGILQPVSDEKYTWRKTWTHMDMDGRLRVYHSGTTGDVQLYRMGGWKGDKVKKVKTYSNFRKGFDIVEQLNGPYTPTYLFYDKQKGYAKIYRYNGLHHNFGAPIYKSGNWHKGWDIIKGWSIGSGKHRRQHVLFYDREAGMGKIFKYNGDTGKLGAETYRTSNWRKTWHSIVIYWHLGHHYVLFYDKSKGEGAVYQFDHEKGKLGRLTKVHKGWRKSWDNIVSYKSSDTSYILFYDKESGDTNVYKVGSGGRLIERVQAK